MEFLERLGLVRKSTVKQEGLSFPQADTRQALLIRAGNSFLMTLTAPPKKE
ncbi:MAG: hypothetical protein AAB535_03530 [Patescibacteria group bacterium]